MDNLLSPISRIVFIVALLSAGVAIFERASNAVGYTLLRGMTGGRLLELSAILVIFVIAVLLREIRDLLRSRSS